MAVADSTAVHRDKDYPVTRPQGGTANVLNNSRNLKEHEIRFDTHDIHDY